MLDIALDVLLSKAPIVSFTALVILDTVLGISKAVVNGTLNSRKLTNGVIKNGSLMLTVWVFYIYLPDNLDFPVTAVIYALQLGQIVSIFENLGLMGVKLPSKVEGILKQLKEDDDDVGRKDR